MKRFALIVVLILLTAAILGGCKSPEPEIIEVTREVEVIKEVEVVKEVEVIKEIQVETVVEKEVEVTRIVEVMVEPEIEPVVLEMYHWFSAYLDNGVIKEINARFHEQNPDIIIEVKNYDPAIYALQLDARVSAETVPDLFAVPIGTQLHPYAEAGLLMNLDGEQWVKDIFPSARFVSTYQGDVMALPIDSSVIGVIYNKAIFADLELDIPTTWEQFLATAETIKAAGIIPISLGLQETSTTQLIPYAMAPSAIYRDNIDFDADLRAGNAVFADSTWQQMMEDYLSLRELGYINELELGTNYNVSTDLLAVGKAAMLVQSNIALAVLQEKAPAIAWGMFPLPYDNGGDVWIPHGVGSTIAVSASTAYPEATRRYLAFWASPEISELYLEATQAFPVSRGVSPELNEAGAQMLPYIASGSYPFLDQNWPTTMQRIVRGGVQSVFVGEISIEEMLQEMDRAFRAGIDG